MNQVKDQFITDQFALYNSDNMLVVPGMKDESIDLSIYSPPFCGLYNYSSDYRDMSNCESKEQFLIQYGFLVKEMGRITKRGRINAVHVTEIVENNGNSWDFPHEVIKLHNEHGFDYKGRITIWKEPLKVRMRTMVKSLMHKLIVEDATQCFPAQPDYLLIFKKRGDSEVPVIHPFGLDEYFGDIPVLPHMLRAWNNNKENPKFENEELLWEYLKKTSDSEKVTKLNHFVWQRYASSVWDDIRVDNVLPFQDTKEDDDEKHVHPLQLDIIDRCVQLYCNPGEVVFTPFMGVGSEVYSPVSLGRKAIGIELKDSYYKQAIANLKAVKSRYKKEAQINLF